MSNEEEESRKGTGMGGKRKRKRARGAEKDLLKCYHNLVRCGTHCPVTSSQNTQFCSSCENRCPNSLGGLEVQDGLTYKTHTHTHTHQMLQTVDEAIGAS